MPRVMLMLLGLIALAGCSGRAGPTPFLPPALAGGPAPGTADASPLIAPPRPGAIPPAREDPVGLATACRGAADRIVTTRDRGQLLREDEQQARIGSQGSIFAQRAETDRLGRIFERDRLAADCVDQNARGPTPAR